jgi:hypothetical protein
VHLDPADVLAAPLGTSIDAIGGSPLLAGHAVVIEHDDDMWHAEATSAGLSFVADTTDGTIMAVQVHAAGHQDHSRFAGPLPAGLSFDHDRATVRRMLGRPSRSRDPAVVDPFGPMPAWDRFDEPELSLHVEYTLDGDGIRMVSLLR